MAGSSSIFNSRFSRAARYLLVFAVPALVIIAVITGITDKALKETGSYYVQEWNDIYQSKVDADIIMLGNSRAWVHLNPRVFDSVTGLRSYNLGIDAYALDFQLARFWSCVANNRKPTFVIQNIDPFTLRKSHTVDYEKEQFLPYLDKTEVRHQLISNGLGWEDRFLPMFKYRGRRKIVFREFNDMYLVPEPEARKFRGFKGQHIHWSQDFSNFKKDNTEIDLSYQADMIRELESMIGYCAKNNITVILAYLPMYDESLPMVKEKYRLDSLMNSFQEKYPQKCYYMDYSTTGFSGDTTYFYNATHLNYIGADSISMIIARRIKGLMHEK